jgi:hypothetical protein
MDAFIYASLPRGVDTLGQQVVERDVGMGDLAREGLADRGETGARPGREAHRRERRLHHRRGDVHDAPEAPLHHALEHGADHREGCKHVGIEGAQPGLAVPVPKASRRRPAVVVDQDVRLGAGGEELLVRRLASDVADDAPHLDVGVRRAKSRGGGLERPGVAPVQSDVHALARQRLRTGAAEPAARGAHDGTAAPDAEIHR